MIEGLILTKLNTFSSDEGSVYHCLRSDDPNYVGFGESYFSFINYNAIKAWKIHQEMTLNLVVPIGMVRFNFIDIREHSETFGERIEVTLSFSIYQRITVPPNVLFGFKGVGEDINMISNITDMVHTDKECINVDINKYEFK